MQSVAIGITFAFLSAGCGACEFEAFRENVSLSTTGLPSECCSWASQCVLAYPYQLEPSSDCTSKLANMESFVLEESFNGGICSGPVCSIDITQSPIGGTLLAIASGEPLIRPYLARMDFFSPMSDKCCSQWTSLDFEDDLSDECRIPLFKGIGADISTKEIGSLCFRASGMVKLRRENGCFNQPRTPALV